MTVTLFREDGDVVSGVEEVAKDGGRACLVEGEELCSLDGEGSDLLVRCTG